MWLFVWLLLLFCCLAHPAVAALFARLQVDVNLYKGLVDRARVHRVQYDSTEHKAVKASLLELRELTQA